MGEPDTTPLHTNVDKLVLFITDGQVLDTRATPDVPCVGYREEFLTQDGIQTFHVSFVTWELIDASEDSDLQDDLVIVRAIMRPDHG